MIQTGIIQRAHNDLLTDASYDFYGQRLATCSLDQRIKIWQVPVDGNNSTWTLEDDWKAHDAAVSRVSWAHPEFGSIIASSSFDRTLKIWEQAPRSVHAENPQINMNDAAGMQQVLHAGQTTSTSRWIERACLLEARGTVRAVEFAPHHFGLKLASISSDNYLRVYECLEQPTSKTWHLSDEIDVEALASSSVSANHNTVALATPTQTSGLHDGAPAPLVAQALQHSQSSMQTSHLRPSMDHREADGGWCLSWCKERHWGEIIAAGCGISGIIKIVQLSPSHRPTTLLSLDPAPLPSTAMEGSTEADLAVPSSITCVAWAPSCGRSYHLIATGGRDGHVRIWRVKPAEEDDAEMDGEDGKWSASIVADFDHHKDAVGRVEWNITGTVLSSAGNDGRIRLWKATSGSVWSPAGSIGIEEAVSEPGSSDMDVQTPSRKRE